MPFFRIPSGAGKATAAETKDILRRLNEGDYAFYRKSDTKSGNAIGVEAVPADEVKNYKPKDLVVSPGGEDMVVEPLTKAQAAAVRELRGEGGNGLVKYAPLAAVGTLAAAGTATALFQSDEEPPPPLAETLRAPPQDMYCPDLGWDATCCDE